MQSFETIQEQNLSSRSYQLEIVDYQLKLHNYRENQPVRRKIYITSTCCGLYLIMSRSSLFRYLLNDHDSL